LELGQGLRAPTRIIRQHMPLQSGTRLGPYEVVALIGVVLYEMATGVLPFRGRTSAVLFEAIVNTVPLAAARLRPEVPAALDGIIGKALEKDRDVRYESAGELLVDLRRLKPSPPDHECRTRRSPRLVTRWPSYRVCPDSLATGR
jgi:serine/threonine protein kinase